MREKMASYKEHKIGKVEIVILTFFIMTSCVKSFTATDEPKDYFTQDTVFDSTCLRYIKTGAAVDGTFEFRHKREPSKTGREVISLCGEGSSRENDMNSSLGARNGGDNSSATNCSQPCGELTKIFVFCRETRGWSTSPQVIALSAALATMVISVAITFCALVRAKRVWTCRACEEAQRAATLRHVEEARMRTSRRPFRGIGSSRFRSRKSPRITASVLYRSKPRAPPPPPPLPPPPSDQLATASDPAAAGDQAKPPAAATTAAAAAPGPTPIFTPPPPPPLPPPPPPPLPPAPACVPGLYDPSAPLLSSSSSMALKSKQQKKATKKKAGAGGAEEAEEQEKVNIIVPFHYLPRFGIRPHSP